VVFVGAGLSFQATHKDGGSAKLPLWKELAGLVATHCNQPKDSYGDLFDLLDSIEASLSRGRLEEAVRAAIPDDNFEPSTAHHELCQIPWHMIVTTNYDTLLARAIPERSPIVNEANFEWLTRDPTSRPKLVHLHGTLSDPHTLTGSDYGAWPEKHPRAYSYLETIALNRTILFVGYSLSDPYLKFGLLPWLKKAVGPRGKRHYAWMWDPQPEQIKLLDKRDSISVVPIRSDGEWADSFRQLKEAVSRLRQPPPKRRPPVAASRYDEPVTDDHARDAVINGYKLYFYRMRAKCSIKALSKATGIDSATLNKLEQVKTKKTAGPDCFKAVSREGLAAIEKALSCVGKLEYGQLDDFLAKYIMFYKVNTTIGRKRQSTKQLEFIPDTKAVVFDFGGTLTLTASNRSTWERMWESVGYTSIDAGNHHRRYLAEAITHPEWCDITAAELRKRGFSRKHLHEIIAGVKPIPGLEETIASLRKQETALYIVSGSVKEIIVEVLGKAFSAFADIKANDIVFDDDGIIKRIEGTKFDFEGKAHYIKRVIEDLGCEPLDVLFVGNSLNDSWAYQAGARTLCINPADVDYSNTSVWSEYIKEMKSLVEILPFARRSMRM
jgi:phosphoserine phosphatase